MVVPNVLNTGHHSCVVFAAAVLCAMSEPASKRAKVAAADSKESKKPPSLELHPALKSALASYRAKRAFNAAAWTTGGTAGLLPLHDLFMYILSCELSNTSVNLAD